MNGIVFDIQHGAIYDGPGIRTCVFFKGCPLRCTWCHNPESQQLAPLMRHRAERCIRCGRCAEACQTGALRLRAGSVVHDRRACTACGACAAACSSRALERVGQVLSPGEIADAVARDRPFYETSGGGATITGGEPTFQPSFLLETLDELRGRQIRTAIETCGHFRPALLDELLPRVDLFLYDIKHADSEAHAQGTGVSSERIEGNFREIVRRAGPARIIPRVPVIPGYNAGGASASGIAAFIEDAGYAGPVELLPFNPFFGGKLRCDLDPPQPPDPLALSREELDETAAAFERAGFPVSIQE